MAQRHADPGRGAGSRKCTGSTCMLIATSSAAPINVSASVRAP
jgi:hypothetical protein